MDTLKTSIVVVLLLAVLYGVYVILNKPTDQPLPQELAWQTMEPPQVELGSFEQAAPGLDAKPTTAPPAPPAWTSAGSDGRSELETSPTSESPNIAAPDLLGSAQPVAQTNTAGSATRPPESAYAVPNASLSVDQATPGNSPLGGFANQPDAATYQPPSTPPNSDAEQPAAGVSGGYQPDDAARSDTFQPAGAGRGGSFQPATGDPADTSQSATLPESTQANAGPSPSVKQSDDFSAFESALQSATVKINENNWHDALWTLSLFYNSPDLTPEQDQQLLDWLDPLAAKVIYSTEHLIEPPHEVQRGESLIEIAQQHNVPWQLLANINGVENPQFLVPGTKVKLVRGPFHAQVNLHRNELTLFVNKLYAGRFAISSGNDPAPIPGEYQVNDKQAGRTYYAGDGRTIPAGDPANPFGQMWLDLGSDISIHGSPQSGPTSSQLGCIGLSPRDAADVFGILSLGSRVTIRR